MQWYLKYEYVSFATISKGRHLATMTPDDYIGPFKNEYEAMGHQAKYGPVQAKVLFTALTLFDRITSPEDAVAYEARA